jgi:hypothetical protein
MNLIATFLLLADNSDVSADFGGLVLALIELAIAVLVMAGIWMTYSKAGQPGWGCLIPFYNVLLMLRIAGRPAWWLLLFLIPLVNIAIGIVIGIDIARNFGKGVGFGLGLAFLGSIFYPTLGFGNAQYQPVPA